MAEPLTDSFARVHTYLRVSVTDRCNFKCVYCLPEEGMEWRPRDELLSYEEIAFIVEAFAAMGVHRVRLTGGEPTARADVEQLVTAVAAVPGIDDVAMTTNGHTLRRLADRLAAAGLDRLNVSLDSLRPERFARLTRGADLARVLDGIDAARAAGLLPVKINAVLLQGENDDELIELVEYFSAWPDQIELRFIEYMPFEARWFKCVKSAEARRILSTRFHLEPTPSAAGGGPATGWRVAETGLRVGFISPLSEHFCAGCNRLRLMADGHLRTCLAHDDTPSLRDLVRAGSTQLQLQDAIRAMVRGKPAGHECETDAGTVFEGVMTGIGG